MAQDLTAHSESAQTPKAVAARGTDALPEEMQDTDDETLQFITFNVSDEEYGVDIMAVREIRAWTETTRLPNAPKYMRGVVNLRGVVVPIFDLRARFGMGETTATSTHVVIIIAVGQRMIGMLVDAVSDILTTGRGEIQAVPAMDRAIAAEFLGGLVSFDDRMVALLEVERLFELDEIDEISETAK